MANQTTVHSGGVCRGRLTGCGCGFYERYFFNFHVSMSVSLFSVDFDLYQELKRKTKFKKGYNVLLTAVQTHNKLSFGSDAVFIEKQTFLDTHWPWYQLVRENNEVTVSQK